MLAFVGHVDHVRDDQLGHDLENHLEVKLFRRTALRNEAKGVL
jgi:hypothetical protein